MLVYATVGDLEAWLQDTAPPNAAGLLRSASVLVTAACRNDLYNTLPSGLPSDENLADAMRDACCEQINAWVLAGIDPATAGTDTSAPGVVKSEIDGARVEFDPTGIEEATRNRLRLVSALSGSAYEILRQAGLASAYV